MLEHEVAAFYEIINGGAEAHGCKLVARLLPACFRPVRVCVRVRTSACVASCWCLKQHNRARRRAGRKAHTDQPPGSVPFRAISTCLPA